MTTDRDVGPITLDDRVSDVLARDEALVAVFESVSPAFARLRKPALRRVMARLVTVEQAARVAGVDARHLLDRLNEAVRSARPGAHEPMNPEDREGEETAMHPDRSSTPADTASMPAELSAIPDERIVELDVRADLREGKEPFSRIMAAKKEVPGDGALKLRAIFEPAPLYAVLAKQGFEHWTDHRGDEDWVVWFYRADSGSGSDADDRAGAPADREPGMEDDGVVVLDVRGLEPPEPMVRTLAALESLPRGHTLVQINVREPRFLLPKLEEQGWEYEVREQAEDLVRVFIRHAKE